VRFSKTFLIIGIVFYAALGVLPFFTSDQFFLSSIIFVIIFALFGAAWDFGFGVAGIINLGPGVAYGLGSFYFVYFALAHYPPVVAVLGAAAIASLAGFVYWIPSLRTSGSYLAIVTLILLLLAGELALARTTEEGVSAGLNYYTPTLMQSYYASLGTAFLGSLILFFLSYSRFGLRLKAMRDDETAAKSVGINVYYSKLASLMISSFFLGLSGALGAFFINHTHADFGVFGITTNFLGIVISVIGGTATIFGSIIGALIVELPANYLTSYSTYAVIAYGATMVLVVLFLRSGILNAVTTLFSKMRRRTVSAEHPIEEKPMATSTDRPKPE
jgi:branched-chain amino acid transport system permease protein